MCKFCLYVCLCTTCMSGACGGQKRPSDPLELNYRLLWAILWVLGTKQVLGKSSRWLLNHGATSSPLICLLCPTHPVALFPLHRWLNQVPQLHTILHSYLHVFSTDVIEHWPKATWGGKVYLVTYPSHSASLRGAGQEVKAGNEMDYEECCLPACSLWLQLAFTCTCTHRHAQLGPAISVRKCSTD